jgi:hypothetical protein
MSYERERQWANEPEMTSYFVELLGTGNGTVPTVTFGRNMTFAYVSTGVLTLTFTDYPGKFVGGGILGLRATTPSALKGYSVVFGDPDSTGKIVSVNIFNSAGSAVDLQTAQRIALEVCVKQAGSGV